MNRLLIVDLSLMVDVSHRFLSVDMSHRFFSVDMSHRFLFVDMSDRFLFVDMSDRFLFVDMLDRFLFVDMLDRFLIVDMSHRFLLVEMPDRFLLVNMSDRFVLVYMSDRFLIVDMSHRFLLVVVANWDFVLYVVRLDSVLLEMFNVETWLKFGFVRILTTVPEGVIVLWHLLVMHTILNRSVLMMLIVTLIVSPVSRVQVKMSLIFLMLIAIVLLLMILEVSVQHATMGVLRLPHIACNLILRMSLRVNIMLHIMCLFRLNSLLDSQISDLFCTQSLPFWLGLLLRLRKGSDYFLVLFLLLSMLSSLFTG